MWDWIKGAANRLAQAGAAYMQHRTFILSLLSMAPHQVQWALKQKIEEMDDDAMTTFNSVLAGLIGEAQQMAQQADYQYSWGGTFEDMSARFMAEANAGFPSSRRANEGQFYLQGLNYIAISAHYLYQEKLARTAQQPVVQTSRSSEAPADTTNLKRMLDELVQTGKLDPGIMQQLPALNDPKAINEILTKLKELGAHEGSSPPLNMADFYRPGRRKYRLKWKLSSSKSLPIPFDQLDRETQFHVLATEWCRRELEGNHALYVGDTTGAQAIFEECIARADQLEVAELKARSYEGLVRVAQKLGDREAEAKWLDAALAARDNG